MHQDNIETIMKQTGLTDELLVRKVYYKNNKDVSDTIIELLNLPKSEPKNVETPSEFTNLRKILDEKDVIFEQIQQYVGKQ